MYDLAEELMKSGRPFILENNFENVSKEGLLTILEKYKYKAITVTLTGDYKIIYQRFLERNSAPGRHPGHVVNDCYPGSKEINSPVQISYESFVDVYKRQVYATGHTHIDVSWLWRLKHTREKAQRSFATVLRLMEEYPEYHFLQTQPQLYKFLKKDSPEIYEGIKPVSYTHLLFPKRAYGGADDNHNQHEPAEYQIQRL